MKWLQVKAVLLCVMLAVSGAAEPEHPDSTYYFNAEVTR